MKMSEWLSPTPPLIAEPLCLSKSKPDKSMKYITFLDILGYKELILNNTTEEIKSLYNKAIDFAKPKIIDFWDNQDLNDSEIEMSIISDSIIIWTNNDNFQSLGKILISTSNLLTAFMIAGLPLRGAIVKGELDSLNKTLGKSVDVKTPIFFGRGLTSAYSLEGKQNWSGCIVDESCLENLENKTSTGEENVGLGNYIKDKIISKYKVPLKSGAVKEYFVLNWVNNLRHINRFNDILKIEEQFAMHNKTIDDWRVFNKIQNTKAYYDWESNRL